MALVVPTVSGRALGIKVHPCAPAIGERRHRRHTQTFLAVMAVIAAKAYAST
jgi:hypothetical protein